MCLYYTHIRTLHTYLWYTYCIPSTDAHVLSYVHVVRPIRSCTCTLRRTWQLANSFWLAALRNVALNVATIAGLVIQRKHSQIGNRKNNVNRNSWDTEKVKVNTYISLSAGREIWKLGKFTFEIYDIIPRERWSCKYQGMKHICIRMICVNGEEYTPGENQICMYLVLLTQIGIFTLRNVCI